MNTALLRDFFLWCAVVNFGALLVWFAAFTLGREWMYRLHSRWFRISPEQFDTIHYGRMAIYKIGILLFNVAPCAALWIIGRT
ncbi:MAG: DUF6868 family protein [Chthoniobacteraceae bacterium]